MTRKNMNSEYSGKNKKMNDDVYKLRKQIMSYIYEAKKLLGDSFKRIDLRITEKPENGILGSAKNNCCIVWIPENTLQKKLSDNQLRWIVFHELGHALFGAKHNKRSHLMHPNLRYDTLKKQQDRGLLKLAGGI